MAQFFYGPSKIHKDYHFAKKNCIKIGRKYKSKNLESHFDSFRVINGNNYIHEVTLNIFLKGIFSKEFITKPQNQMNNYPPCTKKTHPEIPIFSPNTASTLENGMAIKPIHSMPMIFALEM